MPTDSTTLKKALLAIKKLKKTIAEQKNNQFNPIAVVGIGCRLPEASNKNEYWELLSKGKNTISTIAEERWELLKNTDEITIRHKTKNCRGSYLNNIAAFDAYFFGITPREAIRMDPQQRILLEVAYEALEDAGIPVELLAGSNTGVFSSLYASQFGNLQTVDSDIDALYIPTGNALSIAANRLSYLFDLRGPSIVLDTACSSSLVAIHLACLNLQAKLCDLAIVSAVNINLLPSLNLILSKAKMLSPDGQCKTFDASANGYVQGEGAGVVVLKPLSKALRDNDRIYGVIAGTSVNQDGKSNGLTAPNGLQQEALLKSAYQVAQIDPKEVSYVECHGTGTFLGDPIEIQALGEVVGKNRDRTQPCWIGSVKTNIGHLEPAAGLASLIKVCLALQHKQIPPHLNFSQPNPHIAFDKYHLSVPTKIEQWPSYGGVRKSGISGFGFGGMNAHVVMRELQIDEVAQLAITNATHTKELFTLSAKDSISLKILIDQWYDYLINDKFVDLAHLCYNLHVRRSHYFYRLAIVAESIDDLYRSLSELKQMKLAEFVNTNTTYLSLNNEQSVLPDELKNTSVFKPLTAYLHRQKFDWKLYEADRKFPVLDLPHYPWQHQQYWPKLKSNNLADKDFYPFKRKHIASPLSEIQFEFEFNTEVMPEIKDTFNFLHAGYYLEMIAIVVDALYQKNSFTVDDLVFSSPIYVPNHAQIKVQLVLRKHETHFEFTFYTQSQTSVWTQHATGKLILQAAPVKSNYSKNKIVELSEFSGSDEEFFDRVTKMGMPAGDSIRWANKYWIHNNEALCEFKQADSEHGKLNFKLNIHLGIIDGCIQSLFLFLPEKYRVSYIASKIDRITYHGIKNYSLSLVTKLKYVYSEGEKFEGDFTLIDANEDVVLEFSNICMAKLGETIRVEDVANAVSCDVNSKEEILTFLINQMATIFSMPIQDINPNQSLRDLGIDSLMAIVFSASIESVFQVNYSMQNLLNGPSISDVANYIFNHRQQSFVTIPADSKDTNKWITYRQKQSNPKIRLFCFPFGGSGASVYRDWQKSLPETIEVCPIQLPGRENRRDEEPIENINLLIELLIKNVSSEFDLPFVFFGHSFGSLIAFELARALRKCGLPQPLHIIASAFPDPSIPTKSLDNIILQLFAMDIDLFELVNESKISELSGESLRNLSAIFHDNGLVDYGNQNKFSKDIMKVLLPIFIGDMQIVKSYNYQNEPPLDFPMSVFLGNRDTWVSNADQQGWVNHTNKECQLYEFDSGHLFIKENHIQKLVLKKIEDICERF
ncbi:MAG: beta-ketoacyl synthase N-terminal-like domain-containing protein [Gammaproteobacteria bacterium]